MWRTGDRPTVGAAVRSPHAEARRVTEGTELDEQIDRLLADADPTALEPPAFWGAQYDAGLAWVHFPEGRGGLGLPPRAQRHIDARLRAAGAPPMDGRSGIGRILAGPTLVTNGSPTLQDRLLRRAFTGEDAWCQLFSEPSAGSDLAALSTRAVRDGDEWVVTGQKVWNTLAHLADRALLMARTDPSVPKHEGITYFALDMHAPGVEVRPLRQITGDAEFNEVFLTEVRVPDADRIGDVGDGWRVSMTTLVNERSTIGGGGRVPARGSGPIAEAVRLWQASTEHRPAVRDRLLRRWCEAEVLRLTNLRATHNRAAGNPGPEGSIAKLMFAEVNQAIYELCVDLLGAEGLVGYDYELRRSDVVGFVGPPGSSRSLFLRSRANSIEGGTSEIQRNILGERILGLAAEPRVDKDRPWSGEAATA
jgi:alkylation response protein AidB-like acyl-CoA dehydrogenase